MNYTLKLSVPADCESAFFKRVITNLREGIISTVLLSFDSEGQSTIFELDIMLKDPNSFTSSLIEEAETLYLPPHQKFVDSAVLRMFAEAILAQTNPHSLTRGENLLSLGYTMRGASEFDDESKFSLSYRYHKCGAEWALRGLQLLQMHLQSNDLALLDAEVETATIIEGREEFAAPQDRDPGAIERCFGAYTRVRSAVHGRYDAESIKVCLRATVKLGGVSRGSHRLDILKTACDTGDIHCPDNIWTFWAHQYLGSYYMEVGENENALRQFTVCREFGRQKGWAPGSPFTTHYMPQLEQLLQPMNES